MNLNFNTNHKLLFLASFLGFLFLSILIAVGPASVMQSNIQPLLESEKMDTTVQRGYQVYISENCAVCHTQQVRPLKMDGVFGRASVPNDFAGLEPVSPWVMTPNILGTARIGPDLSNVGERRNNEMWNYTHLYNPRAVVEESIMPAYHWLFEEVDTLKQDDINVPVPAEFKKNGKYIIAKQEAKDLIAYLDYLEQPPVTPSDLIRNRAIRTGSSQMRFSSGKQIFDMYCASCHQSNGKGIKNAYPPLDGSTIMKENNPSELIKIVLNGYDKDNNYGKMPGYGGMLTDAEIEAVINYTKKSWGEGAKLTTEKEVNTARQQLKENKNERDNK